MRRRYLVEGDVQGVGFRYFAVRLAQRLGIRGWVRNLPDGSVEAVGEGTPEQLTQFESGLRRGPTMATVTSLRDAEATDDGEGFASFSIR